MKYTPRLQVGARVRIIATDEIGHIEARQAGCYRVMLSYNGRAVLKHRNELAKVRSTRQS